MCSVSNCSNRHKGNGYCATHLKRLKDYGNLQGNPREVSEPGTPCPTITPEQAVIIRRMFADGVPVRQIVVWCRAEHHQVVGALRHG